MKMLLTLSALAMFSVAPSQGAVTSEPFGSTADGQKVERYTLTNKNGLVAKILTFGGILTELHVPDRAGKLADIVLGFDSLAEYEAKNGQVYFGCITGRVANRIAQGKFSLDGRNYTLELHPGTGFHLHGGRKGFGRVVWKAQPVQDARGAGVRLTYTSPDGEDGYPGELKNSVTYVLGDDNTLRIDYEATTSKPTPVNLTNHSYFNLAGHNSGPIGKQEFRIHSARVTETDKELVPTGRFVPVKGTPLDLREFAAVGPRFAQIDLGGYDHNFVLADAPRKQPELAVEVRDPESGRVLEILTDQPAVQFYSATSTKEIQGKGGATYNRHHGFCLETQHHPDAVNHPAFPNTILRPGETYRTTTVHRFLTR